MTHILSLKKKKTRAKGITTLSQYSWTLTDKEIEFNIKWKLIAKGKFYSPTTNRRNLCLKEMLHNFPASLGELEQQKRTGNGRQAQETVFVRITLKL